MKRRRFQKISTENLVEEFFAAQLTDDEVNWEIGSSKRLVGGTTKYAMLAKGSRLDVSTEYSSQLSNTPTLGSITPETTVTAEPDDDGD